nr:MAG TPA_asm: hypothetical protein [Caudoviricetes sp.]
MYSIIQEFKKGLLYKYTPIYTRLIPTIYPLLYVIM